MQLSQKNKKNNLAWYWLSLAGAIGVILGSLIGGMIGAIVTVFGGQLILLFSLAEAVHGGVSGSSSDQKISTGNRIGAFFLALFVALIVLIISGVIYQSS